MATDKTPSSKHGRLHEEEARRAKADDGFKPAPSFTPFEGELPKHLSNPYVDKARPATPQKSGALAPKPAPKARPDITQRMDALRSALSDKYPHNDVQVIPEGLKVAVPTGHITIESEKVAACADNAAIRAYIDALPIQ